jgi:alkaline phosphatase D
LENRLVQCCVSILLLVGFALSSPVRGEEPISRIAFGSCLQQSRPQPIWEAIVRGEPQLFLFIGDNVYADLEQSPVLDLDVLRATWEELGRSPGYRQLKATCPVLATWDDHDFGVNDGGDDYPRKRESQALFLDFFDEPADSPRRRSEGVYDAKTFGPPGRRVQVILLDTRYFRSPLKRIGREPDRSLGIDGPYGPSDDPAATVLGETQWAWLERQLKEPADLRIVASSIQVIADGHRWEKWGQFPAERRRFLDLIRRTRANGVVLISGDRHSAEISRIDVGYPLYDVTSSSLNQRSAWHNEVNEHRVGTKYVEENFGTIEVDWTVADPTLHLRVHMVDGRSALHVPTTLSALRPPPASGNPE